MLRIYKFKRFGLLRREGVLLDGKCMDLTGFGFIPRLGWRYRQEYSTFEDYCREQWSFTKQRAYQLMDAATVVDTIQKSTIVDFFPKTETQARPLASLEPKEQVEAWKRVITSTPEGIIRGGGRCNI